MSTADGSVLKVAPTRTGYLIRLEGRGTMRESPALRELVLRLLQEENTDVHLDLSACEYLDSTCLGCLVVLHRFSEELPAPRFSVVADAETSRRLLGATKLDMLLSIVDACPETTEGFRSVNAQPVDSRAFGYHVLDAHRELSELGGQDAEAFGQVAERLTCELGPRDTEDTDRA